MFFSCNNEFWIGFAEHRIWSNQGVGDYKKVILFVFAVVACGWLPHLASWKTFSNGPTPRPAEVKCRPWT